MTARDAATEADTTDQVEPGDEAVTTEGAEAPTARAWTPGESDATPEPVEAEDADHPEAEEPEASGRRRRAHRHAPGDADEAGAPPRGRRRWPLAAAVVVALLFAAAMVVVYVVTRPDARPGLTGPQQAAIDAASQESVNLQTFRRASFDQDFQNALDGMTSEFAKEQWEPRKATLQKALQAGQRDSTASVLGAGLQSSTDTQAVVLVVTQAAQTSDNGQSTPYVFSRLQITVQLTGGRWLLSDLKSVGLS